MSRNAAEFSQPPRVPATHYLDNRVYWDPDIFREEQQKIFSKVWRLVCHESEMPENFDFRTAVVAETPLITIRGKDGRIRTFVNACSHRGVEIERRPTGNAPHLECIFHRWTYDSTSGECRSMPRREGFDPAGLRLEDCGLREVRTELFLGLVFVNLDDGAIPLAEFIGDALELQTEILGTKPLEVFDLYEQELGTNWKNWQETNMDLYHEFMHFANRRTALGVDEYYQRNWRLYPHGHAAIERYKARYDRYAGWKERSDAVRLPGIDPSEFQLINLFPDVAINARGTVIRIDTQVPLAPGRTLVQYRGLGVKGDSEAERTQRAIDYTAIWGPFGTNLAEDTLATTLQGRAVQGGTVPYTYWAREEGGKTQDDVALRFYYREWERLMGRPASNPFNRPASEKVAS
jgi:phenylpropionate dioxygenase-like ring-hydroxylating dioxygenase large terminal subunit